MDILEPILKEDHNTLKPKHKPRKGWGKLFKKMHENGDDKLVMPDILEDEKMDEWK